MQYGNWWLTEQLQGMRYEDMRRAAERERLLSEHELDLWSVVRRAIARSLPHRSPATTHDECMRYAEAGAPPSIAA